MSVLSLASGWTLPIGKVMLGLVVGFGVLGFLRIIGVLSARYFRAGLLALLAGCAAGVILLWSTARPVPPVIRIAVLSIRPSATTQLDGLGMGIQDVAIDLLRLSVRPPIRIAARDEVDDAVVEREVSNLSSALEASAKLGVQFAVFGEYEKSGGMLRLRAHFLDVRRHAIMTQTIQCGQDSLSVAPVRLVQAIVAIFHLQTSMLTSAPSRQALPVASSTVRHRSTPGQGLHIPPSAAFEQYCLGRAFFHVQTSDGYWQAIEAYRAALQIDSTYAFPYAGLAQVYNAWQREGAEYRVENETLHRKAVQNARKALILDPRLNEGYRLMARSLIALKNWEEAGIVLRQAVLADPDDPLNYVALAQLRPERYRDLHLKDEAALCERAVNLNPDSILLRARLVRAYIAVGKLNDAVDMAQQTVEMAPMVAEGYEGLGEAYNFTNQSTKAVKAFTKALEMNPKSQKSYIGLATAYTIKVDHQHAIATYQRGIAELPRNADLYYNLGVLYQRIAQPEQAIQAFEKAVEIGNHVNAHFYLGHLYEKQGQKEKAMSHWRQRIELGDPSDPWTKDAIARLHALEPMPIAPSAIGVGR